MKQELIYNILPIKAYEIELKCFYASHFILGRIFALWNKKKKAINGKILRIEYVTNQDKLYFLFEIPCLSKKSLNFLMS